MGPLKGFKIIEIAGIGPGQLCGMLLADMGAQVLRIDRLSDDDLGIPLPARFNLMNRSRRTIALDLKSSQGVDLVLDLCRDADALYEGYRPGVMERMGLGPSTCMERNPRLVYGRMTGWGQTGPLANSVGHDSNYIALAGALSAIGQADQPPTLPLNLVGDFGGGALYLAMGLLAAMLESGRSGKGQVVDASMVDGAASMMTLFYGLMAGGLWRDQRGANLLDGSAPFVRAYKSRDGKDVVVCALENRFFRSLLKGLGIEDIDPKDQYDPAQWPAHIQRFEETFATRTRDEWNDILVGTDACYTPVLSMSEAPEHPHNAARNTFVRVDGLVQPAPAPRFSRTPSEIGQPPEEPGVKNRQALLEWGIAESRIASLSQSGVLGLGGKASAG